jgi:hypothetical protein
MSVRVSEEPADVRVVASGPCFAAVVILTG